MFEITACDMLLNGVGLKERCEIFNLTPNIYREGSFHGCRTYFTNGWGISIQIGTSHYCENRSRRLDSLILTSKDCEIAVFDGNNERVDEDISWSKGSKYHDHVYPYLTCYQVEAAIEWVKTRNHGTVWSLKRHNALADIIFPKQPINV